MQEIKIHKHSTIRDCQRIEFGDYGFNLHLYVRDDDIIELVEWAYNAGQRDLKIQIHDILDVGDKQ